MMIFPFTINILSPKKEILKHHTVKFPNLMHKQLYSGQKQLLVYCGDTFTIEVENNHNYKAIFLKKGER